jgi:hypothetical protein
VNSLDMLDDDTAVEFLNISRDYMLSLARMGVWWVLIAKEQFMSILESRAHRVGEVVAGPVDPSEAIDSWRGGTSN